MRYLLRAWYYPRCLWYISEQNRLLKRAAPFNWQDFPSPTWPAIWMGILPNTHLAWNGKPSCLLYPAVPFQLFHMASQIAFIFKTVFAGFLRYHTFQHSFLTLWLLLFNLLCRLLFLCPSFRYQCSWPRPASLLGISYLLLLFLGFRGHLLQKFLSPSKIFF